jgi:hypothetical protein
MSGGSGGAAGDGGYSPPARFALAWQACHAMGRGRAGSTQTIWVFKKPCSTQICKRLGSARACRFKTALCQGFMGSGHCHFAGAVQGFQTHSTTIQYCHTYCMFEHHQAMPGLHGLGPLPLRRWGLVLARLGAARRGSDHRLSCSIPFPNALSRCTPPERCNYAHGEHELRRPAQQVGARPQRRARERGAEHVSESG